MGQPLQKQRRLCAPCASPLPVEPPAPIWRGRGGRDSSRSGQPHGHSGRDSGRGGRGRNGRRRRSHRGRHSQRAQEKVPNMGPLRTAAVATTRPLCTAVGARMPGALVTGHVPLCAGRPVTTIHRIPVAPQVTDQSLPPTRTVLRAASKPLESPDKGDQDGQRLSRRPRSARGWSVSSNSSERSSGGSLSQLDEAAESARHGT